MVNSSQCSNPKIGLLTRLLNGVPVSVSGIEASVDLTSPCQGFINVLIQHIPVESYYMSALVPGDGDMEMKTRALFFEELSLRKDSKSTNN